MEETIGITQIDDIIKSAVKNLQYELKFIQDSFELDEFKQSEYFNLYCFERKTDIVKDSMRSDEMTSVENSLMKSIIGLQKNKEMKDFMGKTLARITKAKESVLDKYINGEYIEKEKLRKTLNFIKASLERCRLYIDGIIYPRDYGLNIIDISPLGSNITKDNSNGEYQIVHKDFITAYYSSKKILKKIKKLEGQDLDNQNKQTQKQQRLSTISEFSSSSPERKSILEYAERDSQSLQATFAPKDYDEMKKQLKNKQFYKEKPFWNLIQYFSPYLANVQDTNEVLSQELFLVVRINSCNLKNHEVQMRLFYDNSFPMSSQAYILPEKLQQEGSNIWVFENIPLKHILVNNVVLIFNIIEKKKSKCLSQTRSILEIDKDLNINKYHRGFTILPISKYFWKQKLKNGMFNLVKGGDSGKLFRPTINFKIEDRYVHVLEKDGLSKYYDQALTSLIDLSYSFALTMKLEDCDLNLDKVNFLRKQNLEQSDFVLRNFKQDQNKKLQLKKEESQKQNDLKINLNFMLLSEQFIKKAPYIRIEIALRDIYGIVYNTLYVTQSKDYDQLQTYESCIYQTNTEINMQETFFIRIPTKQIDALKKLYVIFLVQILNQRKDSKGKKFKLQNISQDLDEYDFQTLQFGILPLYDFQQEQIIKNDDYILTLRQMDSTKIKSFTKLEQFQNFKITEDKLKIKVNVLSNEFAHNKFINNLLGLSVNSKNFSSSIKNIHSSIKTIVPEELINFHDKILDKLFQILTSSKNLPTQDLVFESIIQMISLFQNRYKDYKSLLDNYIDNHFSNSTAYIILLNQVRQISQIIKEGFKEEIQIQKEECLLQTLKCLSIILRLIKLSFKEEQQFASIMGHLDQSPSNNQSSSQEQKMNPNLIQEEEKTVDPLDFNSDENDNILKRKEYMGIKHSVITEEELEDDLNQLENNQEDKEVILKITTLGDSTYSHKGGLDDSIRQSLIRKKEIRQTIKIENIIQKNSLTRKEFAFQIYKSIYSIMEGIHKDQMKSTMSLRAIVYEGLTDILEQIVEFCDEKILIKLLSFIASENTTSPTSSLTHSHSAMLRLNSGSGHKSQVSSNSSSHHSIISVQMGSRNSQLIEDYVTKSNFIEGLKDLSHINNEYITKHTIIIMGQILYCGILDKVQGNMNIIVQQFCEYIEHLALGRNELSLHVFYFLHQLFHYLSQDNDAFSDSEPLSFNKKHFVIKTFCTRLFLPMTNYYRGYLKESNPQFRLKETKALEQALNPFYEKLSLVILSLGNMIQQDNISEIFFFEDDKLLHLVGSLKKISKSITFKQPYFVYFEKKKIQVIEKINNFIMTSLLEKDHNDQVIDEYHTLISNCRILQVILWAKNMNIKVKYFNDRLLPQYKDQLPLKGKAIQHNFEVFFEHFKNDGQPWIKINKLQEEILKLFNLGHSKPLNKFMYFLVEIAELEYKSTKQILNISNFIFQLFNDLHSSKNNNENAQKFHYAFEAHIQNTTLYKEEPQFARLADIRIGQMRKLREAMVTANISQKQFNTNLFYQAYCYAKLMEVFWDLKLFKLFGEQRESFKRLHQNLDNFAEMAFTDLRFLQIIQTSDEQQIQIGQTEITALIQIDLMRSIVENLNKAELYEKSILILNQMKDLYENVLFDFEAVSKVLIEQSKIYKLMSEKDKRGYAIYFKVGFFGQSFPVLLKNQEFIYRGVKLAKKFDIYTSIKQHFPDAMIINDSLYPKSDILEGTQKYLQIIRVSPLTFRELKDFNLEDKSKDNEEIELGKKVRNLPEKFRIYYIENFKNKFYRETIIQSQVIDELQSDIQIEVFKVQDKFPSLFNMQNIIKVDKHTLNAIDKAIRTIDELNEELLQLKNNLTNQLEEQGNLSFLESKIKFTLESPINGGIDRFIKAFINKQYLNSKYRTQALSLLGKIEEHTKIMNDAIQLFSQRCDDDRKVTKYQGDYLKFQESIENIKYETNLAITVLSIGRKESF